MSEGQHFLHKDFSRAHNMILVNNPVFMLTMALLPVILVVAHMAINEKGPGLNYKIKYA